MKLTKEQPKFSTAPNNLKVTIKDASTPVRLINEGYWGMNLVKDNSYQLRTIIRPASDYKGKVTALLLSEQGEVLASAPVDITAAGQWNDLSLAMQPTATSAKGKLALEFDTPGTVYVDYVSLFPEKTFHNRPNGLRKDVAEMLEGLHPAFVRWPGGCVVEGISLENGRSLWAILPHGRENTVPGAIVVRTVSVITKCCSSARISMQRQCLSVT